MSREGNDESLTRAHSKRCQEKQVSRARDVKSKRWRERDARSKNCQEKRVPEERERNKLRARDGRRKRCRRKRCEEQLIAKEREVT